MSAVLIVDDDPSVREVLVLYLTQAGFEVREAEDGHGAVQAMNAQPADLVLLDIMLPGLDGYEVYRTLRERSDVPIIFLTARDEDVDRILGLELGADDYITKPFNPREVTARVKAVLRRVSPAARSRAPLHFERLTLNPETRECIVAGEPAELTAREFDILWLLASRPRVVFERPKIMELVWGQAEDYADYRTIDTHVKRVRRKLREGGTDCTIETVWGVGYRFTPAARDGQ
ncbi:MAG: response regulator transcription factor [Armatimonadetes bacterium]|nr:response regulator transcription factor [Armatimonadota bacterium]